MSFKLSTKINLWPTSIQYILAYYQLSQVLPYVVFIIMYYLFIFISIIILSLLLVITVTGSDGITTFRIKYPNWASFWFQAWHHAHSLLCLFRILKLFQYCTIFGSPFCPILSIFRQLDVPFCLLYEYLFFFTIDVLCSLLEAIRYSGFRNITILKLLSC